ncbi:MAG: BadF/BadG/BcrA/BcrD ATPase family protein [Humibacillus sp.]
MSRHLGIDAGGTSTRAVIVDASGTCLGHGRAGSGNPIASGPEVAAASLRKAAAAALAASGADGSTVRSVAVAMAGGSDVTHDPVTSAAMQRALLSVGIDVPIDVEPDLLALYFSGSPAPDGYALVAGTGAASVRVRGGEVVQTCDGLGWLLGDEGSGFWIGREVVRSVAAALDARGPATTLTGLLETALPGPRSTVVATEGRPAALSGLVDQLYAVPPVHLACFAPLAFTAAASGDGVAARIAELAGRALVRTLSTVLDPDLDGPVVLGGSILVHQPGVRAAVEDSFTKAGVSGPVIVVPDGLVGAAVLALRHAGLQVDRPVFEAVRDSVERLR